MDAKGKLQDSLKKALKDGTLTVPEALRSTAADQGRAAQQSGKLEIKNADERKQCGLVRRFCTAKNSRPMERIKHKTTYRVAFDNEKLIDQCMKAIRNAPRSPRLAAMAHG